MHGGVNPMTAPNFPVKYEQLKDEPNEPKEGEPTQY